MPVSEAEADTLEVELAVWLELLVPVCELLGVPVLLRDEVVVSEALAV